MRCSALAAASVALLALTAAQTNAQYRVAELPAARWPTAPAPALQLEPQGIPLPVYDDDGEVIPYDLIASMVDTSGLSGAIWAGLGFAAVGSLIGALITDYDCPYTSGGYRYDCSPREDAMRSVLPGSLALAFGMTGVWLGWSADVTTWDEALEEIRDARRRGVRP